MSGVVDEAVVERLAKAIHDVEVRWIGNVPTDDEYGKCLPILKKLYVDGAHAVLTELSKTHVILPKAEYAKWLTLIEHLLAFTELGDYSIGITCQGIDEGQVMADRALADFRKQLTVLKEASPIV